MANCVQRHPGAGLVDLEACKRVNYTLGMLLGVDDFVQESYYNGARRRELARELLGYGTVHGLQVVAEADGDKGPRLRVTPGIAWLPSGAPVCVDSDQCANINDWLAAHEAEVGAALAASFGSPPRLTLYLTLSHIECLTDNVPIPGEPCRSDEELMQPSRIADGFRLSLRLAAVTQREEDAVRDFVEWLVRQPLAPGSPPLDEAAFIEQLREAARAWLAPDSPPASPPVPPPDYMAGQAPEGTTENMFRAALRLWVTELRPLWMARADCGCKATPIAPEDDVVLLARVEADLVPTLAGSGGWRVSDDGPAVAIDESRRPMLLSLRMLQELILDQRGADPGDLVVPETGFGQEPFPGTALEYARADHTHGSPELPELGGDLSGPIETAWIESLQGIPLLAGSPLADGQVLSFEAEQWMPRQLGGDVFGPVTATEVAQLQGHALRVPNPAPGQILRFVGNQWIADDLPNPAPQPPPPGQFVGRGMPAPYDIVVAGAVDLTLPGGPGSAIVSTLRRGYGKFAVRGASALPPEPANPPEQRRIVIDFRAGVVESGEMPDFIVKLTPIWFRESRPGFGFRLFLADNLRVVGTVLTFSVLLLTDQQLVEGDVFRFQLEVSRF
jgi:hypothetical protein